MMRSPPVTVMVTRLVPMRVSTRFVSERDRSCPNDWRIRQVSVTKRSKTVVRFDVIVTGAI